MVLSNTSMGMGDMNDQDCGLAFNNVSRNMLEPQWSLEVYHSFFTAALELVRINHYNVTVKLPSSFIQYFS